jgi:hypothetical protein
MYVDRPSCIELQVREQVRIARLRPTEADGYVAEQHGALLAPGVTQLQLEAGIYHWRTLDDAQLRIISGDVQMASISRSDKDPWPEPPAMPTDGATAAAVWAATASKGHGPCGRVPALCVVDETHGVL